MPVKIPFVNSPFMGYQFDPNVAAEGIGKFKDVFTWVPSSELKDSSRLDSRGENDFRDPIDSLENPGASSVGSVAGGWYDAYNAKSQRDFLTGGANMVNNALRDVTNVSLNLAQNNILNQLQSGNEVIVRPEGLTNDVTGRSGSYLDRIFQGKDSVSASDIINNPEFIQIGKKLAVARNTTSSPSGVTWTKENEDKANSLAFYDSLAQEDSIDRSDGEEDPKPEKEPDEDEQNFLERLKDWFLRRLGGRDIQIGGYPGGLGGIKIPLPGGGRDGGFPFPIPLPPIFGGGGGDGGGGRQEPEPTPPVTPTPTPTPTPEPEPEPEPTPTPTPTPTPDPTPGPGPGPGPGPSPSPGPEGPVIDDRKETDPIYIPQWPSRPPAQPDTGGNNVSTPTNPSSKDLQRSARRAAISVYDDPANFQRFAPSPLQTMDSRYRNISSFLPSGEITPYAMNYQRTPGAQYANYPDAPPMQGGPLTTYYRQPDTGGGQPPADDRRQPPADDINLPPDVNDPTDSDQEMQFGSDYEDIVPKPERSDFPPFSGRGQMASQKRYEAALEEWEAQKESFDRSIEQIRDGGLGSLGLGGIGSLGGAFNQGGIATLSEGGFPRVNGKIEGPGTETSDDIPAMLSDGEFVVNAKAVRGIGDMMGADKSKKDQRREGARAMYALQKMGEKAVGMS